MDPQKQTELNKFPEPLKLTLGPTSVITRRSSFWATRGDSSQMVSSGSLVFRTEITIDNIKLEAAFEFTTTATTLTLTLNTKTSQVLQTLVKWIGGLLQGGEKFDFVDLQGKSFGSSNLGEFSFRHITIELVKDQAPAKAKLSNSKPKPHTTPRISRRSSTMASAPGV